MVGAGLLLVAGGRIDATPGLAFVASLLMVAGVGWWDDHRDLSAVFRLLVHLAAGAVAALGVLGVPAGMAEVLALALATLWLAGMLNAWNFMDGINGIASGQAVVVGLALWLVPGMLSAGWALLAMVLAVACAAFLPFNLPRARIFLGDVGSGAIGFSIGVLLLTAAAASPRRPGRWCCCCALSFWLMPARRWPGAWSPGGGGGGPTGNTPTSGRFAAGAATSMWPPRTPCWGCWLP